MRKTVAFLIVFCMTVAALVGVPTGGLTAHAEWNPPAAVASQSVYLVNSDTGTVIYQKNADQKEAPYSITKLMTAILTIQKYKDSLNTTTTVTKSDLASLANTGSSIMDLKAGQQVTVEQLLDGLLIYSGNDAANVLARLVGGDTATFVKQMNEEAQKLGCKNTHYVNPHGLPDDQQYTTAADTYLIAKTAFSYSKLAEISGTTSFTYNKQVLPTTNAMLRKTSPYYYESVKGGKTGSTSQSFNYVSYAQNKSGVTYYCSVFGGTGSLYGSNSCFADALALYKWVYGSFSMRTIVEKGSVQGNELDLKLAWNKNKLQPVAAAEFDALIPSGTDLKTIKVITDKSSPTSVMAPVKKGQKLGTADVMLGDQKLGTVELTSPSTIARSQPLYFVYMVGRFFSSIWFVVISICLVAVFLLYLVLLAVYDRRQRTTMRRRRRR